MSRPSYRTPRTTLTWRTLTGWYGAALALQSRRHTALVAKQKRLHVEALPLELIAACDDPCMLQAVIDLLRGSPPPFGQPPRGQRGNAPHTHLIVALSNRLAQLARASAA